jgi:hypothetical protein
MYHFLFQLLNQASYFHLQKNWEDDGDEEERVQESEGYQDRELYQEQELFQELFQEEEQERGRKRSKRARSRGGGSSRSRSFRRRIRSASERSRSRSRSRSRGRAAMKRSGHATHRLTHEENRLQTCVLCWRRGGRKGSKAVAVRPVTVKLAATLRRVTHHTAYNLECPSHPGGICTTDLKKLLNVAKSGEHRGSDPRVEWRKLKLGDIEVPDPDITWDECSCPICATWGSTTPWRAGSGGRSSWRCSTQLVACSRWRGSQEPSPRRSR